MSEKIGGLDGRFASNVFVWMKAKELAVNEVLNVGGFFSPTLNRWLSKGLFGMFQGYVGCFLDVSTWSFLQPIWQICTIIIKLDGSSSPYFFFGWTFREVSCHQLHPGRLYNMEPKNHLFARENHLSAAYGNVLRKPLKDVCFLWGWTAKDLRISNWTLQKKRGVWICFFCNVLLHLQNPYVTWDSHFIVRAGGLFQTFHLYVMCLWIHPGRLTWNLQITHLERKMNFQTSMILLHINLLGV